MYILLDIEILNKEGVILEAIRVTNAPRPTNGYITAPFEIDRVKDAPLKASVDIRFSIASKEVVKPLLEADTPFIWVRIYTVETLNGSPVLQFVGLVSEIAISSQDIVVIRARTFEELFKTVIPPAHFQPTCNWTFGSEECGLRVEDFTLTFQPGEYQRSGRGEEFVKFPNGIPEGIRVGHIVKYGYEYRNIVDIWDGNYEIQLSAPFSRPLEEGPLEIIKICDKSLNDCIRLGNEHNFSGFPFASVRNPSLYGVEDES